jgi:carbonic anhydrase/acetyltransferase-like protein (isoleucine patch superfamily)
MPVYELDGVKPTVHPTAYIEPGARIVGNVEIQAHATVWFNAVLRGDREKITVGEGANVQDGAVVHTDPGFPCTIGRNATIGHQVVLHGCTVEEDAVVGMGATVLNGAVVREGAFVAAGSLVPEGKTVESRMLVAGVPAKPLKPVSEELLQRAGRGSAFYRSNGAIYARSLRELPEAPSSGSQAAAQPPDASRS